MTMRIARAIRAVLASVFCIGTFAAADQAGLTIGNASLSYCNKADNSWQLTHDTSTADGNRFAEVSWVLTLVKNNGDPNPPPKYVCVEGSIAVTNTGSASAPVGNLVVNLQRQVSQAGKTHWISASADIATAKGGSASATHILALASAENPVWNRAAGINNYSVDPTSGIGTFSTNAASGTIEFLNGSALSAIPPGNSAIVSFRAKFNNDLLSLTEGAPLRSEVIVTFGGAGNRGAGRASACGTGSGFDIDGDGEGDGCISSVPVRTTLELPPFIDCNAEVALTVETATSGPIEIADLNTSALPASTNTGGTWTITSFIAAAVGTSNAIAQYTARAYGLSNDQPCCEFLFKSDVSQIRVDRSAPSGGGGGGIPEECLQDNPPEYCNCLGDTCSSGQPIITGVLQ